MLIVPWPTVLVLVMLGWAAFAFFHYRHCMQQELLAVLAAGVRGGLPLHAAVTAFAADRPEPRWSRLWTHVVLFLMLPGLNVYQHWRNFRRKTMAVADALTRGAALSEALRHVRGVAGPETVLAAAVGEASGKLAEALERAHLLRDRVATLWTTLMANLAYPLALLVLGDVILRWQFVFVVPKLKEIMADFGPGLPDLYVHGVTAAHVLDTLVHALLVLVPAGFVVRFSSTLKWHLPGVAWYYRARARAQVAELLAFLLEAGRPLPECFGLLAGTAPHAVAGRLQRAAWLAEQGESLATCLCRTSLIPRRTAALLESAQRSGSLAWALREVGESLTRRLQLRVARFSSVVCPLLLAAIGGLFALACVGLFYPLVYCIEQSIPPPNY